MQRTLNQALWLALVGLALMVDVCVRRPYRPLGGIRMWTVVDVGLATRLEFLAGMLFFVLGIWLFCGNSKAE
jgi:hypothetical protein